MDDVVHRHSACGCWAPSPQRLWRLATAQMLGGSKVPASSLRRPRRPPDPTTAEPPVPPGAFAVGDVVHVRPSALRRGGAGQQGAEEEEGRDRQAVWPTAHVVLVDERASVATVELAQVRRVASGPSVAGLGLSPCRAGPG